MLLAEQKKFLGSMRNTELIALLWTVVKILNMVNQLFSYNGGPSWAGLRTQPLFLTRFYG